MSIRRIRLLLAASLLMVGVVVSPLGDGIALAHPNRGLRSAAEAGGCRHPGDVHLHFDAYFHDPYAPITRAEWRIQGAGTFTGNQVTVTAPAAGPWTVRLHVRDPIGEDGQVTKVVNVQPLAPHLHHRRRLHHRRLLPRHPRINFLPRPLRSFLRPRSSGRR